MRLCFHHFSQNFRSYSINLFDSENLVSALLDSTISSNPSKELSKETRDLIEGENVDYTHDSDVISAKSSSDDSN